MRIYNTLTHRIENIVPVQPGLIRMYSCGPTVYRNIHIGNLRTFVMADWLRRSLIRQGYEIEHIKNITDVGHMRQERLDEGEDKMLTQARREGRTSREIADHYTEAFHHDERRMNILPASFFPRATAHISDMIAMITELEAHGFAYRAGGNVYFDVHKFKDYGQLSGNQLEGMLAGNQEGDLSGAKRNEEDFPLWKAAEPGREMVWDSPWGCGFPGWHIECSAMATKYLGKQFDIHTGGVDNIFPHHENELAQSEGYTGQQWVRYWMHGQHLLTDGLKMAKSTSNDYILDDIIARGFDPLDLRYLFTTAHYRSHLNFTFTALGAAHTSLHRLRCAAQEAISCSHGEPNREFMAPWQRAFDDALNDDLNLPKAMGVVWDLVRRPSAGVGPEETRALLEDWDQVLGLDLFTAPDKPADEDVSPEVKHWVEERAQARAEGDYAKADAIRGRILRSSFEVRDTPGGTQLFHQRLARKLRLLANSHEAPNRIAEPDQYDWSIDLIARNNRDDLDRCLRSLARNLSGRNAQILVIDNGSTDDTLRYLQDLSQQPYLSVPDGGQIPVEIMFADHNLGFAAARNATMSASSGRYEVLLDTSIEITGDIWTPIEKALSEPDVGIVGPYGLVTSDLREFEEAEGPDADAIEGYLMAFRRELLRQIGLIDNEKFRFYRLADIYYSFFFKAAGLRALVLREVAERLIRHPHREWYSLLPEEQATKSKKNYDLLRERWHHGESLLVMNAASTQRWRSHDDPRHLEATHTHPPEELPPSGQPHLHAHRHLPDHEHAHLHYHNGFTNRVESNTRVSTK